MSNVFSLSGVLFDGVELIPKNLHSASEAYWNGGYRLPFEDFAPDIGPRLLRGDDLFITNELLDQLSYIGLVKGDEVFTKMR